jgi:hydroxymethylglutaryl-CoA reductase (NADPH)
MQVIPKSVLGKLYNRTSLRNTERGVRFSVKNRLAPAGLHRISQVAIDGRAIPEEKITVACENDAAFPIGEINPQHPVEFPLGSLLNFFLETEPLPEGSHEIRVVFDAPPYGALRLEVQDALKTGKRAPGALPRDPEDDYEQDVIRARQDFLLQRTGVEFNHISAYSFDPHVMRGNIEHFTGVAQVPLGFAGPLLVDGEHAQGEFYVPLACTEGTLVASYNRGMKVLHGSGGVKCAVVGDGMQRAPVFLFEDAASARRFVDWVGGNTDGIRKAAEATDPFVKLDYIDPYLSNRFAFMRFNFTTGDAAGQNMVGKATLAACNWILQFCDAAPIEKFYLESNFATDKKASMINILRTRGKRVTAEAVIRRDVLQQVMDADTESLYQHYKAAMVGTLLSGANNNGCHAANAIAAIFLATGQDVANVSESSAGILYAELLPNRDLHMSITLPSLIVATCGGGTGLPTQREALQAMDCCGPGKVRKFAEIVAGTVLAGEVSLAAAISSLDWVSSHDQYGRNDPRECA